MTRFRKKHPHFYRAVKPFFNIIFTFSVLNFLGFAFMPPAPVPKPAAFPLPVNSLVSSVPVPGPELKQFSVRQFIAKEALYFTPGIGVDAKTGIPYDHIRIRRETGKIKSIGEYSAASKLSLSIPFYLFVIQRHPDYQEVAMTPEEAARVLETSLQTLLNFQNKYPDYQGFFPWVKIQPHGTITPHSVRIPSLDNGQLSWALAALETALGDSETPHLRKLAAMAGEILSRQNYRFFLNSKTGYLYGEMFRKPGSKIWQGTPLYELTDMYEGTMAVLWAVLHAQVPDQAWDKLWVKPVDYTDLQGKKWTVIQGFRASFHEQWALAYLPFMKTRLKPLYENYMEVQKDYARRRSIKGLLSTAYEPGGVYRQIGIKAISSHPVERDDVQVVYATAMGMLIDAEDAAQRLNEMSMMPGVMTAYGAVESFHHQKGAADILTADGKGMTLLAVSGGITPLIEKYLQDHTVPGSQVSMAEKFHDLTTRKFKQLTYKRYGEPIHPAPETSSI